MWVTDGSMIHEGDIPDRARESNMFQGAKVCDAGSTLGICPTVSFDWPKDTTKRTACLTEQRDAIGRLNGRLMGSATLVVIRTRCQREWLGDYAMMDICEASQVKALTATPAAASPHRRQCHVLRVDHSPQ
jgi:hypothetical protein